MLLYKCKKCDITIVTNSIFINVWMSDVVDWWSMLLHVSGVLCSLQLNWLNDNPIQSTTSFHLYIYIYRYILYRHQSGGCFSNQIGSVRLNHFHFLSLCLWVQLSEAQSPGGGRLNLLTLLLLLLLLQYSSSMYVCVIQPLMINGPFN